MPAASLALDRTIQELIDSAAAGFPLVTMFVKDEDIAHIGVPVRWTPKWVYWRHLDRNAEWVPGSHRHRQSDIIRHFANGSGVNKVPNLICVDFGGRYESSLARVAGLTSQLASEVS